MSYPISLACLNLPEESKQNVQAVLASGQIGQVSPFLHLFEQALCDYTGARHCIVTSNGTMADAIAVAAMKVKYNPIRVIVPALTFIAQPNAVYYNGVDIQFMDINEEYILDWDQASKYFETNTVFFPSDCLGRAALKMVETKARVIEDACEAFGTKQNGWSVGRFGELGTFSFFVSHTISTGEGGAILTDDDWLANLCYSLRSHGRASDTYAQDKFSFPHLGFNGKMTGMQAAIGVGLLQHVNEYIERRHANYLKMQERLGGFPEREGEYLVPHGFPIEFNSEMDRNDAFRNLIAAGIECRKFFSCIPTMEQAYKFKREFLGRYAVAEHVAFTHLYVPCHQNLEPDQVDFIIRQVLSQNGRHRGKTFA